MNEADSIPTRQSLLARLKDWGDDASWRDFFDTYWRLIHAAAVKAGLTEMEAREVVQDVMIEAAKKMREFTYEPGKDSLKGWLLAVTRWKVGDQFRKRQTKGAVAGPLTALPQLHLAPDDTRRTATVERVPDPRGLELDSIWDSEWQENRLRMALGRVKRSANPAHYEIYHLHVVQGLSARDTARALGVSAAAVYLAKHRISALVKKELQRLEHQTERDRRLTT